MKTCTVCNIEKTDKEFEAERNKCRKCRSQYKMSLPKKRYGISVTEQTCTCCKTTKTANDFHTDPNRISGLHPYCRICAGEKQKAKYQRQREKYNKKSADRYSKIRGSEEYRAKARTYQKRKMETDPRYVLTRRLRNRLYYALKKKSWKKGSKLSQYLGCDIPTFRTHIEAQFLPGMSWKNQGEWHLDHIIPLDSAETEAELYKLCHYTNIQPLWGVDNIKKGTKL